MKTWKCGENIEQPQEIMIVEGPGENERQHGKMAPTNLEERWHPGVLVVLG